MEGPLAHPLADARQARDGRIWRFRAHLDVIGGMPAGRGCRDVVTSVTADGCTVVRDASSETLILLLGTV